MLYDVLITRPFDRVFTYSSSNKKLKVGQSVIVPFGKKEEIGIIWETNVTNSNFEIKNISKIIENIILKHSTVKFISWIAKYTLAPIGSVLKLFLVNKEVVDYILESKIDNQII